MSAFDKLLAVRPMTGSAAAYVPAVIVQRLINLARTIVFIQMMASTVEFGLWSLACMVFSVGATVVTVGAGNGVFRYVSRYQLRAGFGRFYRRVSWRLTLLAAGLALAAAAAAPILAPLLMGTVSAQSPVTADERVAIYMVAVLNALLAGLYLILVAWMRGLRVYRLLSCMDVLYSVLFIGSGVGALVVSPTAMAALGAHAGALAVVLVIGSLALRGAVARADRELAAAEPVADQTAAEPTVNDAPMRSVADDRSPLGVVLRFSVVAMAAGLLGQVMGYVSLRFIQRHHHEAGAGLYGAYLVLCQAIPILAATIWTIALSHVAVLWERGDRTAARRRLETVFKLTFALLVTLAVVLCATAGVWLKMLPESYRLAREVLPWLLMHMLAVAHLGYAYVASHLRERPGVFAAAMAVGIAANVVAAWGWVPGGSPLDGAVGGAQAAAVGGAACAVAGGVYLLVSRFGASWAALGMILAPTVLLLPSGWALAAMAAVWLIALRTRWVFSGDQKTQIAASLKRMTRRLAGR